MTLQPPPRTTGCAGTGMPCSAGLPIREAAPPTLWGGVSVGWWTLVTVPEDAAPAFSVEETGTRVPNPVRVAAKVWLNNSAPPVASNARATARGRSDHPVRIATMATHLNRSNAYCT